MQIKTHKNFMIVLWILMALLGTGITMFASMKLSDEWNKGKELRATHLLPQTLLMDFELDVELDENLKTTILKKVKEKTNFVNANFEDFNEVDLSVFFNEKGYNKNPILKKNYSLNCQVYRLFKEFRVSGFCSSKDKNTRFSFTKKESEIVLSSLDRESDESYIEVRKINTKKNSCQIFFNNIQINLKIGTPSQFLFDLDDGDIRFSVFYNNTKIKVRNISNCFLKTEAIKYFEVVNINNDTFHYNGKLKLQL